jgi:gas vesicle protein
MWTPNAEWLFKQAGYAPARSFARDTLAIVGLFTAGVVVGGAAIALFTPKTGRELRADISTRAGNLKERVVERGRQLKENVDDARARAREDITAAAQRI